MDSLRLLLVHPGADSSTHDVFVGYRDALAALGHEVHAYPLDRNIIRADYTLKQWCQRLREQGRDQPDPTTAEVFFEANLDIISRAACLGVDAILIISAMYTPLAVMRALRRLRCPVGLILTESPYDDDEQIKWAPLADVVWTNERTSVEVLRRANERTYYLPAAYDPARHTSEPQPGDDDQPAHDVVFVGTGFPERIALLEAVDWTGIDLGLYGNWEALADGSPLRPYVRGGVIDNAQTAALYRRAKIGLNLYRTSKGFEGKGHIDRAESLNPRAYELAACGCFQIGSFRLEMSRHFGNGVFDTAVVYDSLFDDMTDAELLNATIRLYLDLSLERERITQRDLLAVRGHTFAARAEQLLTEFAPVIDRQYALAYG